MKQTLWQRAASFAARHHHGQLRKDGVTPYVAHPFRVALTLRHVFGIEDETCLAIALLHDTIEDTLADFDDLREEFGPEVASAVAALSKDKRLAEEVREPLYDEALKQADWRVQAVKLADAYDNLCDSATSKLAVKALGKAKSLLECLPMLPETKAARAALSALVDSQPAV